jgi:hypothetical protein
MGILHRPQTTAVTSLLRSRRRRYRADGDFASMADIGQLDAIAAIPTFLDYFLEKDLHEASEVESSPITAGGQTATRIV